MARARIFTFAAIGVLFVLLVVFSLSLARQLRDLSTTQSDNIQWSLSQVETELSRLGASVARAQVGEQSDIAGIQFRAEIMLSRLNLLESGQFSELFVGDPEADRLRTGIGAFGDALANGLDTPGALTMDTLPDLLADIDTVAPHVRKLALLGVSIQASQAEARREEFASKLLRTGGAALALLFVLSVGLVWLDLLLSHARHIDHARRLATRRLTATVEASLDAIVTIDQFGKVREFNSASEQIFGWTRDEILGQSLSDTLIPPQHRAAHVAGMQRFLNSGKPAMADSGRIEFTALRKSGEEFPVELNITSAHEETETLFIAYLRDISQRIITEQGLIDARDRAQRTDKAKSQFLAVMSHEMRTPLNGILGVLDLLKTTALTRQQARYAKIATASSEILLEHVNEALDITRIESGALTVTPVAFDLAELVGDIVEVLDPLAREKGLQLELNFDPPMARAFQADANRIRQILTNLVGNAIKFTPQGRIEVAVTGIHGPQSTALKIDVSDTGPGIGAEDHETIFQDFTSLAHSGGRQRRSDGMGLAISRRIARLMDGDLTLTSTRGAGSAFTLTLPLKRVTTDQDQTGKPAGLLAPRPKGAPYRVLIVEDNAVNRSVLRDMLQGLGHIVSEASTGLEGMQTASRTPFDLILMDISMPVMDGVEATRRIRQNAGPNRATRIVGLTAHGREEYREQAISAGMNKLFTKPLRLPVLRQIVGKARIDDPETVPQSVSALDLIILTELKQVLGAEKLADTAASFFTETNETLAQLPGLTATATGQALHRIRGAAALLGLSGVLTHLDIMSAATKDADTPTQAKALKALRRSLQQAETDLRNLP